MNQLDRRWLAERGSEIILDLEHSFYKLCYNLEHITLGLLPLEDLIESVRIKSNLDKFLQECVKRRDSTVDHVRRSHSLRAQPVLIKAVHAKSCVPQSKIHHAQTQAEPSLTKIARRSMGALGPHLTLILVLELLMEFQHGDCQGKFDIHVSERSSLLAVFCE